MIIETIYMWVIWFILKLPDLEVRITVETELYADNPIYNPE
jgi:hypothetical protein